MRTRAIVVSDSLPQKELVVGDKASSVADAYLHAALKPRVNGTERGSLNARDLALAFAQIPTAARFSELFKYLRGEDPKALFTEGTTYARVENELIILAMEQAALIKRMAIDANFPCGEHAPEAGDRLKGSKPDANPPLHGIVGPTEAVYKSFSDKLDKRNFKIFKKFFEKNGCERLHLFDLERARKHFTRHGGGTIEENVYVLHPKDDGVLVPIATYHADLLAELHQEFVVALGKLGAQSLTIETIAGTTYSLEADINGQARKKKKSKWWHLWGKDRKLGEVRYNKGENDCQSITWRTPTYDPEHAMDGCSLVQDSSLHRTILKLLKTSDMAKIEQQIEIDTTFNLGIPADKLINCNFKGGNTSRYKYVVEFFPRAGSATRIGSES